MRPALRITMRSAITIASWRSCVTCTVVMPSLCCNVLISCRTSSRASRPARSALARSKRATDSPAYRRSRSNSAIDDGDRFNLDHRVVVGKTADLDRCAGRRCRAEIAHSHVGVLGELRVVGDVSIGLDDVGQGGPDGFEAGSEVLADLLDLRAHIALANANPLRVARQLAGDEDHLAGATYGNDLGVPSLAVDHADMDALRLNLLAPDRHCVPFPWIEISMICREQRALAPTFDTLRDRIAERSGNVRHGDSRCRDCRVHGLSGRVRRRWQTPLVSAGTDMVTVTRSKRRRTSSSSLSMHTHISASDRLKPQG